MDAPGLVAWRSDAAEANLRMGRPLQARKLAEEQLARCTGQMPRAQGVGLRLLAATEQARHRPMLLRQAADLLQNSGDLYELARTLADLAQAYQALGESRRAGMIGHRARALAEGCEAAPLRRALSQDEEWESGETAQTAVAGVPRRCSVTPSAGWRRWPRSATRTGRSPTSCTSPRARWSST